MAKGNGVLARWITLGVVVALLIGGYISSQTLLKAAVQNQGKRIERNEVIIFDIKSTLIEIANNQKWMMKRMK